MGWTFFATFLALRLSLFSSKIYYSNEIIQPNAYSKGESPNQSFWAPGPGLPLHAPPQNISTVSMKFLFIFY